MMAIESLQRGFFGFFLFLYDIQHCLICRLSNSTVWEDAGIEPRTVATTAVVVRRSNHSARSHPRRRDLIHLGYISSTIKSLQDVLLFVI
jgi:hypothetical protein